ncbi:MAG: hypothetical protein K0R56_2333 [Sphingomonas sp.]|jgi:hypothetical protein|nr:hypothetical protein [Sphingomonas sp.]
MGYGTETPDDFGRQIAALNISPAQSRPGIPAIEAP